MVISAESTQREGESAHQNIFTDVEWYCTDYRKWFCGRVALAMLNSLTADYRKRSVVEWLLPK
jgi:hypothetical protein